MPVLREEKVIDRIEVLEDGTVNVREATVIYRDDVEISRNYHRHFVSQTDDDGNPTDVVNEHARVKAVFNAVKGRGKGK